VILNIQQENVGWKNKSRNHMQHAAHLEICMTLVVSFGR